MNKNPEASLTSIKKDAKTRRIAGSSLLTGFFALIGASCCALPLALVNLGLSSALVSHLGIFARAKPLFMGLTLVLIGTAIYFSFKGGRRPNRKTAVILAVAVILVLGSYILPSFEGQILKWLNLK
ncbi:MAG: hypothetical protein JKX72_10900 [Robiginitomaculum sp.]|nr:hypothetical protein [Robiginitomaculum sp.]